MVEAVLSCDPLAHRRTRWLHPRGQWCIWCTSGRAEMLRCMMESRSCREGVGTFQQALFFVFGGTWEIRTRGGPSQFARDTSVEVHVEEMVGTLLKLYTGGASCPLNSCSHRSGGRRSCAVERCSEGRDMEDRRFQQYTRSSNLEDSAIVSRNQEQTCRVEGGALVDTSKVLTPSLARS